MKTTQKDRKEQVELKSSQKHKGVALMLSRTLLRFSFLILCEDFHLALIIDYYDKQTCDQGRLHQKHLMKPCHCPAKLDHIIHPRLCQIRQVYKRIKFCLHMNRLI